MLELKRAAVAAAWELVGGAASLDELREQLLQWRPDVVVVTAELGLDVVRGIREALPGARVVSLGFAEGADAEVPSLDGLRESILGMPPPGGPISRTG